MDGFIKPNAEYRFEPAKKEDDYDGPVTSEFMKKLSDIQLMQLARDLERYPEDRIHWEQVQKEIAKRAGKEGANGK